MRARALCGAAASLYSPTARWRARAEVAESLVSLYSHGRGRAGGGRRVARVALLARGTSLFWEKGPRGPRALCGAAMSPYSLEPVGSRAERRSPNRS